MSARVCLCDRASRRARASVELGAASVAFLFFAEKPGSCGEAESVDFFPPFLFLFCFRPHLRVVAVSARAWAYEQRALLFVRVSETFFPESLLLCGEGKREK